MKHADAYLDDDDDTVVPDGGVVRVPLYLTDSMQGVPAGLRFHDGMGHPAGHKRGYVFGGNAEQRQRVAAAYDERTTRLQHAWRISAVAAERNEMQLEAWRKPGARPGLRQDASLDRAAAYSEYLSRIENRWRTP